MKITGLRKVSAATQNLKGYYDSIYLQLSYNSKTGEVFTSEHCDYGHNSISVYEDPEIINCGIICEPTTISQIRDMVNKTLQDLSMLRDSHS